MPDFTVSNHGTIWLLTPLTSEAREWVDEYLPEDALTFRGSVCVEPRYMPDIVDGILSDGLEVA